MLQVEIKGKSADRFRAYGAVKLLRKPTAKEHVDRALAGTPSLPPRSKLRYDGEDVIAEGEVTTGAAVVNAPKGKTVTRIVFFKGPRDKEIVVGSVDANATGKIEIEFIEPKDDAAADPVIVDV